MGATSKKLRVCTTIGTLLLVATLIAWILFRLSLVEIRVEYTYMATAFYGGLLGLGLVGLVIGLQIINFYKTNQLKMQNSLLNVAWIAYFSLIIYSLVTFGAFRMFAVGIDALAQDFEVTSANAFAALFGSYTWHPMQASYFLIYGFSSAAYPISNSEFIVLDEQIIWGVIGGAMLLTLVSLLVTRQNKLLGLLILAGGTGLVFLMNTSNTEESKIFATISAVFLLFLLFFMGYSLLRYFALKRGAVVEALPPTAISVLAMILILIPIVADLYNNFSVASALVLNG